MQKIGFDNKVLVSRLHYDLEKDKRFLIPFLSGTKIGFANTEGDIIIRPQFDYVLDDFFHVKSLVRVGEAYSKVYPSRNPRPSIYLYKRFGILKSDGSFLIPMEYEGIAMPVLSDAITLRSMSEGYAVIDFNGNIIVPFGVYNYIDGFDQGFARVKIGTTTNGIETSDSRWGIINDEGEIIVEPVNKNIWNFYGKAREYTKVVTSDSITLEFHFNDGTLRGCGYHAQKEAENQKNMNNYSSLQAYRESTYEEYSGTYAQDIMGYSDQDINDAFDGDPEAYWNID